MKKLFTVILLFFLTNTLMAQSSEIKTKEKKNIFSVSLGVVEVDIENNRLAHDVGPAGSLEYQRILTPHIRVQGEVFGHGIYGDQYISRVVGLGAGVIAVPFGDKFKNFQVGASVISIFSWYVSDYAIHTNNYSYNLGGGLEFTARFNVVDNSKWFLGVNFDVLLTFNQGLRLYTSTAGVRFGLKF